MNRLHHSMQKLFKTNISNFFMRSILLVSCNESTKVVQKRPDPYYGAPVVILVLADGSASTFVEDGSCVLENMMLAAHALGLGTVWVHREREIFDSESGKALLREWKLPETLRGVGAIALGYPAKEAGQPAARKQNYIVRI